MKKILKFTVLSAVLLGICISCKKPVNEYLVISIHNDTDNHIHVTLYPKEEYKSSSSSNLYLFSDRGDGYRTVEFVLEPNESIYSHGKELFQSRDLTISPYSLASKVFDSIHISLLNNDSIVLKFTHMNVMGYSENMFTESSTWDFKIMKPDGPNWSERIWNWYHFLISKEKLQ